MSPTFLSREIKNIGIIRRRYSHNQPIEQLKHHGMDDSTPYTIN